LSISRNPEASGTKPQIKHTVYGVLATWRVNIFTKSNKLNFYRTTMISEIKKCKFERKYYWRAL